MDKTEEARNIVNVYLNRIKASEFPVVRQAREYAQSELRFYNEMIKQKMTNIDNVNAVVTAVRNGQYIVGSFSPSNGMSFSQAPTVHNDVTEARRECKRLASINPGKMFMFMKFAGAEMVPTTPVISI